MTVCKTTIHSSDGKLNWNEPFRCSVAKRKNNPLHVGEPGVGKTSLAYGLAARIEAREVPERLLDCRIYELDLGTLLAGTQYRGDFEKRLKTIMEGVRNEGRAIIYIDEIHNLIGAGRTGDGSMDASNMLKPYLESGDIRFIGSTTYEEYNRYFARSKGLVRRFQQIDILEPSIEETIHIVEGLKEKYEEFHGVTYHPDVIPYAVKASVRYISDRFLPDKAIDLVDEAGAYREIHPISSGEQIVDKTLITDVLARICKVDALAMKEEDTTSLETLHARISAKIYGQEEAVRQVVEAVQMSKAGLLDENKPLASLLFVGPTGVGKTEVAKVLASELGISLQRFDMSEYTEKHTVAKLIGSPAGYVGYEDGGLLTDAIRKTPNCVLLLDEIEKAHPDVFNILLQVMDYAVLTDNKGRKSRLPPRCTYHDFKCRCTICPSGIYRIQQSDYSRGSHVEAGQEDLQAGVYQPSVRYCRFPRYESGNGLTDPRQEAWGTEQQACRTPDRDGTEPGSPQLVIATWIPARIWRPRNGSCDSFASETTPDARNLIRFLKIRW